MRLDIHALGLSIQRVHWTSAAYPIVRIRLHACASGYHIEDVSVVAGP